ncbi:reverse transcriptase domain-containing protein [Tanacetum coccineum]
MQKEKEQQDKLKAVKARLLYGNESERNPRNHEESHYSKSKTPTARTEPRRRHGRKHSRSPSPVASVFRRLRQNRSPSLRLRPRKEGGVFNRLGRKEQGVYTCSDSHHQSFQAKGTEEPARKHHHEGTSSRRTSGYSESEDSKGGHWKSKSKRHRTRMPSHVKTYNGSGDPEDHIKLFQSVAKTERWAMPTWCHMFNSTLIGNARVWFNKLPKESIDSYEDLRAAFRENYRQQTKHIKDPVEIHHIKQRDGESTEDFMEKYKEEVLDAEGAPECMKISGFMHGITHPESHYSESKTPTTRTKPRRRHGSKHSRNPSPVASVFRRLKQNRSPSPRLRPQKEGGVFNRLGRKEPGAYTHSDSHHQSS